MSDKRISAKEAHAKIEEGYAYVDVRTEREFEEGHPEGAVNVPLLLAGSGGMIPNQDFARVMHASFPRNAKIVVGCKAGGRSLKAAGALVKEGYTDVFDQRAGWDGVRDTFGQLAEPGWSRVGLPVEAGAPSGRSYADMKRKVKSAEPE
jgi:rhodanese-related sulfurtransferase